jgi:lipopolysaccharide transport system permease protein
MKIISLSLLLGWQDLRQSYRRSVLGQFWITLGVAVQVAAIGLVFGLLFGSPIETYLPFLALGIIFWAFFTNVLNEASLAFVASEPLMRQLSIEPITYVFRVVWKGLLTLGHNLVIVPVVFVIFGLGLSWTQILFIPGLLVVLASIGWLSVVIALISVRYRDMPPIVASILTVGFYVTPVMWQPEFLPGGLGHLLLGLNPFYHLLQIVRLPLLGEFPTAENWTLSIFAGLAGWFFASIVYRKLKSRVAYWL